MTEAKPLCGSRLRLFATPSPDFFSNVLGDFGSAISRTLAAKVRVSEIASEASPVCVGMVLSTGNPLKIVNEVVGLDSIPVVHLKGVVTGDERLGNKAVDEDSFSSFFVAQNVLDVSAPGRQGLQNPAHPKPLSASARQQPAAPAKGTDLVNGLPFRDRSPLFFHGDSLLHFSSVTQLGSV